MMTTTIKRALIFVGVIAVGCGVAWIGGYDFDTRGYGEAVCAASLLVIAGLATTYPGID